MKSHTIPIAVHLFLQQEKNILLLKRHNTGYEDGNYSVIAGHVEVCENPLTAIIRESKEEAGITIFPENLQVVQVMHRKSDMERIDYFYFAKTWSGNLNNKEPHKCSELKWFPLNALPENTVPYIRYALEAYQTDLAFTYFGWDTEHVNLRV